MDGIVSLLDSKHNQFINARSALGILWERMRSNHNDSSLLKNSTDEFTYNKMILHSLLLPPIQQSAQTDVLRG
jgi:hypothetical protein